MKQVILKSFVFSSLFVLISFFVRQFFGTAQFLADVSGISSFLTIFGTLYGILTAFVVFEVWGQYNKTALLVDQEAQGLERLFRLTNYFRDNKLTQKMRLAVEAYANKVIEGNFSFLGSGQRNTESGKLFRKIATTINGISFNDDHDQTIFSQIVDHYGKLFEVRTERINQSLTRLPILLKTFLYLSSTVALLSFIIMPFVNFYYQAFTVMGLGFLISMVMQLIEDLDNPFKGAWNLTTEPYVRTLKHIEEDYKNIKTTS